MDSGTNFDDNEYRNYNGRRDYVYDLLNNKTLTQTISLATQNSISELPKIDFVKIQKEIEIKQKEKNIARYNFLFQRFLYVSLFDKLKEIGELRYFEILYIKKRHIFSDNEYETLKVSPLFSTSDYLDNVKNNDYIPLRNLDLPKMVDDNTIYYIYGKDSFETLNKKNIKMIKEIDSPGEYHMKSLELCH